MQKLHYLLKCAVYLLSFAVTWNAMSAVNYEKILKKGHVKQAQVLYVLIVLALSYLAGSFICIFTVEALAG